MEFIKEFGRGKLGRKIASVYGYVTFKDSQLTINLKNSDLEFVAAGLIEGGFGIVTRFRSESDEIKTFYSKTHYFVSPEDIPEDLRNTKFKIGLHCLKENEEFAAYFKDAYPMETRNINKEKTVKNKSLI